MFLISTNEAHHLLEKWESGGMEKSDWTHEMHLIMGMAMLVRFGDRAVPEMRSRILRHNEATGTANTDTSGYHETLTVYWLWAIRQFMHTHHITSFDEVSVDLLIHEDALAERNGWLAYFHPETIKSVEARRGFVWPEIGHMEGVEHFVLTEK